MRLFAISALVAAAMLAAPQTAEACGGEGAGQFDEVVVPQDTTSLLLARARDLNEQAADADAEAAAADRRARNLIIKARGLQQRAVQREGIELAELLEDARTLALQAAEAKAHAKRARQRAQRMRAQARDMRARALQVNDFEPRRKRPRTTAFAL